MTLYCYSVNCWTLGQDTSDRRFGIVENGFLPFIPVCSSSFPLLLCDSAASRPPSPYGSSRLSSAHRLSPQGCQDILIARRSVLMNAIIFLSSLVSIVARPPRLAQPPILTFRHSSDHRTVSSAICITLLLAIANILPVNGAGTLTNHLVTILIITLSPSPGAARHAGTQPYQSHTRWLGERQAMRILRRLIHAMFFLFIGRTILRWWLGLEFAGLSVGWVGDELR